MKIIAIGKKKLITHKEHLSKTQMYRAIVNDNCVSTNHIGLKHFYLVSRVLPMNSKNTICTFCG